MEKGQETIFIYFEKNAPKRDKWKKRNRFYQKTIERQFAFIIPEESTVLELGCSTGDLLNAVNPAEGVVIDFSEKVIEITRSKYPHLGFHSSNILDSCPKTSINYTIASVL